MSSKLAGVDIITGGLLIVLAEAFVLMLLWNFALFLQAWAILLIIHIVGAYVRGGGRK